MECREFEYLKGNLVGFPVVFFFFLNENNNTPTSQLVLSHNNFRLKLSQ